MSKTLFFVVMLAGLILIIEFNLIAVALEKLGLSHRYAYLILIMTLLGSFINVPIGKVQATQANELPTAIEPLLLRRPISDTREIVVAVNIGG